VQAFAHLALLVLKIHVRTATRTAGRGELARQAHDAGHTTNSDEMDLAEALEESSTVATVPRTGVAHTHHVGHGWRRVLDRMGSNVAPRNVQRDDLQVGMPEVP